MNRSDESLLDLRNPGTEQLLKFMFLCGQRMSRVNVMVGRGQVFVSQEFHNLTFRPSQIDTLPSHGVSRGVAGHVLDSDFFGNPLQRIIMIYPVTIQLTELFVSQLFV